MNHANESTAMNTVLSTQPIAGLTTPAMGEARIRDAYPSVAANFAIATLGHRLTQTIFLAPVAWVVMGGVYFAKILPFMARRYSLTNRRVIQVEGVLNTRLELGYGDSYGKAQVYTGILMAVRPGEGDNMSDSDLDEYELEMSCDGVITQS